MTGQVWLVVVLLAGAAVTVAWPVRANRVRQHAVLDLGGRTGPGGHRSRCAGPGAAPGPLVRASGAQPPGTLLGHPADRALPGRPPGRRDPTRPTTGPVPTDRSHRPRVGAAPVPTGRAHRFRLAAGLPFRRSDAASTASGPAARAPVAGRTALPAATVLGAGAGALLGGPVAALVLAAYGALAARAVLRRRARQATDLAHRRDLDQIGALAADLRAGLPAAGAIGDGTRRTARLARAAVRLADRTGAPLAELLERVEADARTADRGMAAAAAQAAGARATAWLLAALPLGGIALGYAIGVDPVAVLLHTPVGGGCALAAVALQIGGLLWAERLGAAPGRAA
ncbi:type II secretion system F family protein [Micromonospora sp. MA102]|uniref:type II secretion system F family protein n=1 Tax=Micromonospora sp. MA102 TaxID=2952755 RepID=UPI0021C8B45B|nr:hypothetical protein [Micromonospora sp. MA102]